LVRINDALRRNSLVEACKYTVDTLALIQTELDWCFHTDPVLPFMGLYFLRLSEGLAQLPQLTSHTMQTQVALIIQTNEQTITRIGHLEDGEAKEAAPDPSVEPAEIEYRQRYHAGD